MYFLLSTLPLSPSRRRKWASICFEKNNNTIDLNNNKNIKRQKAKRAARPTEKAWTGGFARFLTISHCVSQH